MKADNLAAGQALNYIVAREEQTAGRAQRRAKLLTPTGSINH
jgi:hypothetical protein